MCLCRIQQSELAVPVVFEEAHRIIHIIGAADGSIIVKPTRG
jgi:hypothetical protein